MSTSNLQDLTPADRVFAELAQARLRASEGLNYVESARLSATRAQVRGLAAGPSPAMRGWGWLAVPAALAAVTFSVLRFDPAVAPAATVQAPSAEDLLLLSSLSDVNASTPAALEWEFDEAGPDFYRDLAFYQWLQSRSSSEPNA